MAKKTEILDGVAPSVDAQVFDVVRTWAIVAGFIGIAVGIYGLLFPTSTLTVIGLLFGVYLIVAGITHLGGALGSSRLSRGWRWFQGVLGGVVLVAGILALNNPFGSLAALTIVTGIGWIIDGAATLSIACGPRWAERRWAPIIVGVLAITAGIILIVTPHAALSSFLFLGSLLLIGVGVGTIAAFLALGVAAKKKAEKNAVSATAKSAKQ